MAISNERLVSLADGIVRFRWRDYARGNRVKTMALPATDFVARVLLHVVQDRFVRIRHFGLLGNRGRGAKLARCRELLAALVPAAAPTCESLAAVMLRLAGVDITRCPECRQGCLRIVAISPSGERPVPALDTS